MKIPLTRKQTAPRNVAAKALREGQFQPKVEPDPKGYTRRRKQKPDPLLDIENSEDDKE